MDGDTVRGTVYRLVCTLRYAHTHTHIHIHTHIDTHIDTLRYTPHALEWKGDTLAVWASA